MSLRNLVHSSWFTVHRLRKTVNCQLSIVNCSKGFSLIELLVVISIIGLLTAIGTASLSNTQQKGRDAKRKSDLKAVQQALELYYQSNGEYPNSSSGAIQCNVTGDTSVKAWGSAFTCSSTTYMQQLPRDPISPTSSYDYSQISTTRYSISADLENINDPDLIGLPCTPTSGNYCVENP